jgi:hypothetical protein
MNTKQFTLDLIKFDNSDPHATTYDAELCKVLGISLATLNKYLPRKLYPRDRNTGVIKGIRPRMPAAATAAVATASASVRFSEPLIQEAKALEAIVEESSEDTEEADEAEEAEVLEMAFKKSKKYKEPINIKEVVQGHYDSKTEAYAAINKMARTFEDLCPPLTYSAKPKKRIKQWNRDDIWLYHNGPLTQVKCPCCQIRIISRDSFSAGHIQAESRGGSSQIENIIPICDDCNGRMGPMHMYWFSWDTYGIIMFTSKLIS